MAPHKPETIMADDQDGLALVYAVGEDPSDPKSWDIHLVDFPRTGASLDFANDMGTLHCDATGMENDLSLDQRDTVSRWLEDVEDGTAAEWVE